MKQIAVAILSLSPNQLFSHRLKIPAALNRAVIVLLILFLFIAEIFRVYLVMPYPGSQQSHTVDIAYWLNAHITWIRIAILLTLGITLFRTLKSGKTWEKLSLSLCLAAYIPVFYLFNLRFDAEQIFHQPTNKSFIPARNSIDKSKLVIGVLLNGETRAYPIQLIGYHHQVIDTIGNEPVMITYCTVCRTGRVYSTVVGGKNESFRLVGMDHYNAVFEDESTKTWWQQANGKAIAGPLKGSYLREIPSRQLTIDTWLRQYPNSVVMTPDSLYDDRYFGLEDYDRGTMQSSLVKRDYRPWQPKSWVIGIKNEFSSRAYDWSYLVKKRLIQDSLESLPVLLAIETDTTSFHVYDRRVNGSVLLFSDSITNNQFIDRTTNSTWNMDGLCIEGPLKGKQLTPIQAFNEFWHAWQRFETNPTRYVVKE